MITRFRIVLVTAMVLVAAVVGIVAITQPTPPDPTGTSTGGTGSLIAVSDRVPAPELTGITGWVNSPPLTLRSGAPATLVDFWTFSCVNCVRTFPHLHALLDRYAARGLRIIGVHSPEFDFEKDPGNVRRAVSDLGVTWPVALDPDMATWNAFGNRYWPGSYLVDSTGRVAYVHFGEGDDERTDAAVRALVGAPVTGAPSASAAPLPSSGVSPELYAGGTNASDHHTALGDNEQLKAAGSVTHFDASAAPATQRDAIELSGDWIDRGDHVEAAGAGHIRLRLHAHDVFIVGGSVDGVGRPATLTLDGKPVPAGEDAADARGGTVSFGPARLYHLLQGVDPGEHVLDIAVGPGTTLFTFTFG